MSHRLFVAIAPPAALCRRLADAGGGVRGARWLAAEDLHLTVRFIGEVDGDQADDIDAALRHLTAPAFTLTLVEPGAFGSTRRRRSVHVRLAPSPALKALKGQVDSRLAGAGIGADGRRFVPHITLARLRGAGDAEVGDCLAALADAVHGKFAVRKVVLFESHLGAAGADYARAAIYPLGQP